MTALDDAKPGDVFAWPHWGSRLPTRVVVERVTQTQIVDQDGRRWRRTDGRRVGQDMRGNGRGYERIIPWTDEHTRAEREDAAAAEYRRALDSLGAAAYNWDRLPGPDATARALPHLLAAVAALTEEP